MSEATCKTCTWWGNWIVRQAAAKCTCYHSPYWGQDRHESESCREHPARKDQG